MRGKLAQPPIANAQIAQASARSAALIEVVRKTITLATHAATRRFYREGRPTPELRGRSSSLSNWCYMHAQRHRRERMIHQPVKLYRLAHRVLPFGNAIC